MARRSVNTGAPVRARLLRLSAERSQNFDLILTHYAIERLLYRLSLSRHADRFVLKGAMLLMTWFETPLRPTRDLDLLGHGDPAPESILAVFKEVLGVEAPDGIVFDVGATRIGRIREDSEYGGLRLRTRAVVDGARIAVSIDIAFGDATEPAIVLLDYPVLLDMPPPRQVRGYARETVVAEKFQAIVALGKANTRVKDYYDLWALSRYHQFDRMPLAKAISATFARRRTEVPRESPDGLTQAFARDRERQLQWEAFKAGVADDPGPFDAVVAALDRFLMSAAAAARESASCPLPEDML